LILADDAESSRIAPGCRGGLQRDEVGEHVGSDSGFEVCGGDEVNGGVDDLIEVVCSSRV